MEIYLLHGIHIDDRMQYRESPEQSADLPAANLHVYLTYLRVERAGRVAGTAIKTTFSKYAASEISIRTR